MKRRHWGSIAAALAGLVILGATMSGCSGGDQVVRLHVIANSDSPADQAVKLQVRDAILARIAQQPQAEDVQGAYAQLGDELPELVAAAQDTLDAAGMGYAASAQIGRFDFPARDYGGQYYPAGEYPAVRVVLGEGAGRNWWCVMYPPLCLMDMPEAVDSEQPVELTWGLPQFLAEHFGLLPASRFAPGGEVLPALDGAVRLP
ncbi:MAG: stage II sporulation protein R [Christensenellales bacterium]|jgi:stage II sporulation protein R